MTGKIERILLGVIILMILPFFYASCYADIDEYNSGGGVISTSGGQEKSWHFDISGAKPNAYYTCVWDNNSQYLDNMILRYVNGVNGASGFIPVFEKLSMKGQTDESGNSYWDISIVCQPGQCLESYYDWNYEACNLDMDVNNNSRFGIGVVFGLMLIVVIALAMR